MRFKKFLQRSAIAVLVLLAVAGHVVYQYLPRARPGVLRDDTPIGRLLASDRFPVALWMPYPHQNLAFLKAGNGTLGEGLRALARLAGLPAPDLPSFGPLPVPPASAMAIASDESGERYAILAEVYPTFAAFARLAGRLADNPWLRGGEIYVGGRRAEIRWQGNLWTVASPELPALASTASAGPASGEEDPPALAVIQVRQAAHPLPSGRFLLSQRDAGLEIVSAAAAGFVEPRLDDLGLSELGAFLFAWSGADPALGESAEALVGFAAPAGDLELPRLATIWEGGERRSLPGESLLELVGRRPYEGTSGRWSMAALDRATLESCQLLASRLKAFEASSGSGLTWALWLDLGRGLAEIERLVDQLSQVPIVPPRRLERWRDVHAALAPFAERYSRLSVVVTAEPRALRLRLSPALAP